MSKTFDRAFNIIRVLTGLFVIVLCSVSISFAQEDAAQSMIRKLERAKPDTNKVLLLSDICYEYAQHIPEKGIPYGKRALRLAERLNYNRGIARSHCFLGISYTTQGKYDLAVKSLKEAYNLHQKMNNSLGSATILSYLSAAYQETGDYTMALHYSIESTKLYEKAGDELSAATMEVNSGFIMIYNNEPESALGLCESAIHILEENEASLEIAKACQCFGGALEDLGDLDSALFYYNEALAIAIQENDISLESYATHNIGIVYHKQENYKQALKFMQRSLEIDDSLGYAFNVAKSYFSVGNVYLDMGLPEKAAEYTEKAIAINEANGSLGELLDPLQLMAESYHEMGADSLAYVYRKKYDVIKDSVFNETKNEQFLRIKEQFESEKKEKEIVQLQLENEKISTQSERRNLFLIGSGALLLLLLFATILFFRQRKAKELQKQAELEQKALRAQMNPHFLFNSLNSVQRLYIEGNLDLANDYMGDFADLLRRILDNSSKSLVSVKEEVDTLKLYLELEKVRTDSMIDYELHVDEKIDLINSFVPPLIIQPFTENAIWHGILPKGEKGIIQINLTLKNETSILCTIEDDGIGITKSLSNKSNSKLGGKHKSKGMTLTAERLGGTSAVLTEELSSGGTKVSILIPVKHHD